METLGCSGMTHSAAMAGEILPGKTLLEALNTDLVCDAINVAMRELFCKSFTDARSPLSAMTDFPWARDSRTSERGCAVRWAQYIPPISKA